MKEIAIMRNWKPGHMAGFFCTCRVRYLAVPQAQGRAIRVLPKVGEWLKAIYRNPFVL